MKISFQELLTPLHEHVKVNGEPFFLGRAYNNIVREDDNIIVTFMNNGTIHIELKECEDAEAQEAYIKCNAFINTVFPGGIKFQRKDDENAVTYFGFVEFACLIEKGGVEYTRTVNIDNSFVNYKDDREPEHDGINIYITETPVPKKKKKGKK